MLNKLLMRGLFNLEMPPEKSNCWMTHLTHYTTVVDIKLLSYVESLWETAEKDKKMQNNYTRKICKLVSRLYSSRHVFGPLLSSFCIKFTRYSSHSARKNTKTSYNTRYPFGTNYYKEIGVSTQSCSTSGSAQNSGTP